MGQLRVLCGFGGVEGEASRIWDARYESVCGSRLAGEVEGLGRSGVGSRFELLMFVARPKGLYVIVQALRSRFGRGAGLES